MSDAKPKGWRSERFSPLAKRFVEYGFSRKAAAHYLTASCGMSRTRAYEALNGTTDLASEELRLIATLFDGSDLLNVEAEAQRNRDREALWQAAKVASSYGDEKLSKNIETLRMRLDAAVEQDSGGFQDP